MKSKSLHILLALIFSVLSTISAFAEKHTTLEDLVSEAVNSNKDLLAAKAQIDAAKGRLLQSGRLTNPEIEYSRANDSAFNQEGEFSTSVALIQKFPLAGRLSRETKVAKLDVELAELEVSESARGILREVTQTSRSLLIQRKKVNTLTDVSAQISKLVQSTEKRFKAAEVSEIDINLSRAERNKVTTQLELAKTEVRNTELTLLRLLGRTPEQKIENFTDEALDNPKPSKLFPPQELLDIRPDYLVASKSLSKAKASESLARAERFEDISVGVEYSRDRSVFGSSIGNQQDNFLGIRLSVPLPIWNQNEGQIAEAKAEAKRSELTKQAIELKVAEESSQAQNNLVTLISIQEQYKVQTLPLIEKNLELSRKGYEQGLVGVSGVIQALQQYLDGKLGFLSSMSDLAASITQFEYISAKHLKFLHTEDTQK